MLYGKRVLNRPPPRPIAPVVSANTTLVPLTSDPVTRDEGRIELQLDHSIRRGFP